MPKETFLHLPSEKKQHIEEILLENFYNRHISQVKVSEIVEAMQMSRGAFYKYFQDLEDAYAYLIKKYSMVIHGEILQAISKNKQDFFAGIETFLIRCSQADPNSHHWRMLLFLTQSNNVEMSRRRPVSSDSPMVKQWLELLALNQFDMTTTEEALSFLYFVMALVMGALTDCMTNQWTTAQVLQEFQFRKKWLLHGIKH